MQGLEKSGSCLLGVLNLLRISETSLNHPQLPFNRRQAEGYDIREEGRCAMETQGERSIYSTWRRDEF